MRRLYLVSWMMEQEKLEEQQQSPAFTRIKEARQRRKSNKGLLPCLSFSDEISTDKSSSTSKRRCLSDATARMVRAVLTMVDEGVRRNIISWV